MNLSFFSSFFKKKNDTLHVPDSILVKRLKSLCSHSNLLVYSNIKIYHHAQSYNIPLIMLDPLRGLYIFEIKTWSYDDLKHAHIQKAKNQDASPETLSFDNTHKIIRKKFNELVHNDGISIFNYLIMENLSADEYQHLNESFKELLPFDKLIFSDYQDSDIFKKLQEVSPEDSTLPSASNILATLFIQYAVMDEQHSVHLATQEQIEFIDEDIGSLKVLSGPTKSGKTSVLMLKVLSLILENPSMKIIILQQTTLACDIFKKKLLELVEYAIVEMDLTSIEIITPLELLNRHYKKLHKPELLQLSDMDDNLLHKKFDVAKLIICDDSNLLPIKFIEYLKHIQSKVQLILVNEKEAPNTNSFTQMFHVKKRDINFTQTNPYAKTLHIVQKLLNNTVDEDILIISNRETQEKLQEDLDSFVTQVPEIIDSTKHLIEQRFSLLKLATYLDINALSAKHIIMLDICSINPDNLEYAFNIATLTLNILYEEECEKVTYLKEIYESSKERGRVEEDTLS